MESLNTKLYEKYKKLKKRKFFEEEGWNDTKDADLRSYQSAVEDLIEELKNTNERLRAKLYSIQEQSAECEKLLLEESKKSAKELSDEVGRLQNRLAEQNDINDNSLLTSPCPIPGISFTEMPKSSSTQKTPYLCEENGTQNQEVVFLTDDSYKVENKVPDCCRKHLAGSSDASEDFSNCVFQTLTNFLVGMDFSVDNQAESLCLLVVHKRSGYSFSLTWIQHEGGEGELMYHVSSLGTLERVAVDWMKDDMMFSTAMCHVFFERVSRVVGRC
nr:PREDICTED: uncharacterized protein LOC103978562 isoform X1 [Musa acuminata subsp. malaccensis]XP_018678948.1 PREDICTED: uncharacterized protein LOC103978562 isoform X1 [Musa acuminata subsp. malaccensis]